MTLLVRQNCSSNSFRVFKSSFYGDFNMAYSQIKAIPDPGGRDLPLKFANNEAIALLYNGKAEEALAILLNHKGTAVEAAVTNLSAIADLSSVSGAELKKKYLLKHLDNLADSFSIPVSVKIL